MTEAIHPPAFDPASDSAALLNRIGLAILGVIVPCLLVATRHPLFLLMPVGAVLILSAALVDSQSRGMEHIRHALSSPILMAAVLFSLWCLASLAWDPFRGEAALRFAKVLGTLGLSMVTAAYLPERTKTSNLNLPPIGVAIASVFALVLVLFVPETWRDWLGSDVDTLRRGAIGLETLLWPVLGALALRERWNYCGLLTAVVALVALFAGSQLALFALVLGAITFAITLQFPRHGPRTIAVIIAISFLLAPLLPLAAHAVNAGAWFAPTSQAAAFFASLEEWRQLLLQDKWRILTGHGLDSAYSGLLAGYFPANVPSGLLFEIWFDLGLPGIFLAAAISALSIRACRKFGSRLGPFMLSGLISGLFIAMTDISISQLWWVNIVGIAGIAITHIVRGRYLTSRPKFQSGPPAEAGSDLVSSGSA